MNIDAVPSVYFKLLPGFLRRPVIEPMDLIGMVGTAEWGPVNEPVYIDDPLSIRRIFGKYGSISDSEQLTLARGCEIACSNGGSKIVAIRLTDGTESYASLNVEDENGTNTLKFKAKYPGTKGNRIYIKIENDPSAPYSIREDFTGDGSSTEFTLSKWPKKDSDTPATESHVYVDGVEKTIKWDSDPSNDNEVGIYTSGSNIAKLKFFSAPSVGAKIVVKYFYKAKRLIVSVDDEKEYYTRLNNLDDFLNAFENSDYIEVENLNSTSSPPNNLPANIDYTALSGGSNGASITTSEIATGLDMLLMTDADIIVVPGFSGEDIAELLETHCIKAEDLEKERIAIYGSALGTDITDLEALMYHITSKYMVVVAPGISVANPYTGQIETLPASYTACAMAGLIASLPPHHSPTMKPVQYVVGLEKVNPVNWQYTRQELNRLINDRISPIGQLNYTRAFGMVYATSPIVCIRGITASTDSAWQEISTVRTVLFMMKGVRSLAKQFLGLPNTVETRTALKTTVESFLRHMYRRGMLVPITEEDLRQMGLENTIPPMPDGFYVEVYSTREMQRLGEVRLKIWLAPTLPIIFIEIPVQLV